MSINGDHFVQKGLPQGPGKQRPPDTQVHDASAASRRGRARRSGPEQECRTRPLARQTPAHSPNTAAVSIVFSAQCIVL